MPNRWAVATGNWSTASIWNNGAVLGLPTASDDVFISGSFTVTLDQDINVLSLNTRASGSGAGAIAGGGFFNVASSRNINAGAIRAGTNTGLYIDGTGMTVNITGSITGSDVVNAYGLALGGSFNNVNISGSILGGAAAIGGGISFGGTSNTIRIIGNITGGAGGNSYGLNCNGAFQPTIIITGSITGAGSRTIYFVNSPFGSLNISGSLIGTGNGHAIIMQSNPNASISVVGDLNGLGGGYGIVLTSLSLPYTVNIVGNLTPRGLQIQTSSGLGRINITGNLTGTTNTPSLFFSTTAINNLTVNVSGSVSGGGGSYGIDVGSNNFNNIIVTGSVLNFGITNASNSPITVNGSVTSGGNASINNTSTGQVTVGTAVASTAAAAINNTGGTPVIYEAMTIATNGTLPITGPARLRQGNNNFFSCSLDTGGYKTLINVNNISNGLPAASDIRRGTTYNFGDGVGTMAVPSASYVDSGVAVDNTVGTAVYTTASLATTVWDTNVAALTGSNSVGERLRNISTVSSTGDQLVALL